MSALRIFPVRHHSPAAALALAAQIRATPPRLILIEGPGDATGLIPLLCAGDTLPPVGLLAYLPATPGDEPKALIDPYCAYSPEYAAMKAGQEMGCALRFFDVPSGLALSAETKPQHTAIDGTPSAPALSGDGPHPALSEEEANPWTLDDLPGLVAEREGFDGRFGFRDHAEFWDSLFEMPHLPAYDEQLRAYGGLVRQWQDLDNNRPFDLVREAFMRAEIRRAIAEGYGPDDILIVCGAAHADALEDYETREDEIAPATYPAATLTLIPYSYLRLSEQSGYGAGNRAPLYYQYVYEAGGDFGVATRTFLLLLMQELVAQGHTISLADAIEADRLATNLAMLRGKIAPGLEELVDAATSCYGRGQLDIKPTLWRLVIGDAIGAISGKVEQTSLQQEFHATAKKWRIPISDSPKEVRLAQTTPNGVYGSTFLHRLRTLSIPFASLTRSGMSSFAAPTRHPTTGPDGFEQLLSVQERWQVQWSPYTDIKLIETTVEGTSLDMVCRRRFTKRMTEAASVSDATHVLLDVVLCGLPDLYPAALARCDTVFGGNDDVLALARACHDLHQLATYGTARELDPAAFVALLEKLFVRTVLLLPMAAVVGDDEAAKVCQGLKILVELVQKQPRLDAALFYSRVQSVVERDDPHPMITGLAATLLYLNNQSAEEELLGLLARYLSPGEEVGRGAQFLAGFLSLNRAVLLRNRAIVAWLDRYLSVMPGDSFRDVLPILRRTFEDVSRPELSYLLQTLSRIFGLTKVLDTASLAPADLSELAAADNDVADLLGAL